MCHNQYAKSGPYLKDLYQRENLASGDPVNDDNVTAKIKEGGPGMPAFRTSLSDTDIADLRAYFHSGKCCVEGENPPANPWYRAETQKWSVQSGLNGGATGMVRIASGDSPEGVGVQLVAPNGVRTTVYTDAAGKFEFPKMQAGSYTLRIPTPVPFKPYRRDSVSINGATKLDDIVLERVADSDNLPASPELESQLSSAEILWNLPGTAEEKATLQKNCSGCHSWQQIFRNHYDEHSWSLIVDRMMHFTGTAIAVRNKPMSAPDPEYTLLVKFLSRVRGPGRRRMRRCASSRAPAANRPRGSSSPNTNCRSNCSRFTMLPLTAQGNIWFTSHKTRYVGKMDPKHGHRHRIHDSSDPRRHAGNAPRRSSTRTGSPGSRKTGRINSTAWIRKTGEVKQVRIDSAIPINAPSFGNFTMDADGFVWDGRAGRVAKIGSGNRQGRAGMAAAGELQLRQPDFLRREVLGRQRTGELGQYGRDAGD